MGSRCCWARATLVKLPSVTHSFDESQRFYELTILGQQFNADNGVASLQIQPLRDINGRTGWYDCPRGIYMLFILIPDGNGGSIPSNGVAVKIGW